MWELLALRPLFGATEQMPTSQLMQTIQTEEPERLPKYNRAVPADLEAVVMKCLEKDPRHRYATAEKLADDLARFLAGQPVRARPVGQIARFWRWCHHRDRIRDAGVFNLVFDILGILCCGLGLVCVLTNILPGDRPGEAIAYLVVHAGMGAFMLWVALLVLAGRSTALWIAVIATCVFVAVDMTLLIGLDFDVGGVLKAPAAKFVFVLVEITEGTIVVLTSLVALLAYYSGTVATRNKESSGQPVMN
jgi:hypothetical protein